MEHNPRAKDRIKYRFDNFMSRGGMSVFLALVALFFIAFVVMGLVRWVFSVIAPDESVGPLRDQLWRVFLQISDAGAVAEDGEASWINKAIGIVTIFLGLVLFSSLVAFITSLFEAKLQELKKGKSLVLERNHTLILGFGDRVLEIIRELIIANDSEKDAAIVVLSELEKDEMDDFFRDRVEDRKTTRIITRSGATSGLPALQKVGATRARSVVVLNDAAPDAEPYEKELGDARVIKTIMAVLAITEGGSNPPIVAELHSENKRQLAGKIAPNVTVIEEHRILAKLIVQCSRISGLSLVYDNLVGFDGCELYFVAPQGGWKGLTYGALQFHFDVSSVVGYRDAHGRVVLNPPPDTPIRDDFDVLVVAEDDSTIAFLNTPVPFSSPPTNPAPPRTPDIERQLIVGWSMKSPLIVDEFADYLIEGSTIDVLIPQADDEIRAVFDEMKARHASLSINLYAGGIHDGVLIETLHPERYTSIIILKEDGGDAELRDAETITTLLEFRHHFRDLGVPVKTQLISEVADSDNVDIIQKVGVRDFLISNRFVSRIYAQVSEDPHILSAYDQLFQAEGSEIYLKPLSFYLPAAPPSASFADLCAAAVKRNESCFGVRIRDEETNPDHGVYVNPPKKRVFDLTKDVYLITLAEDET